MGAVFRYDRPVIQFKQKCQSLVTPIDTRVLGRTISANVTDLADDI